MRQGKPLIVGTMLPEAPAAVHDTDHVPRKEPDNATWHPR